MDRSRAAKKFKVRLEIAEKIDEEQKWKDPSARQIAAKSRIVLGSMSPTRAQHHDDDDHDDDHDDDEDGEEDVNVLMLVIWWWRC